MSSPNTPHTFLRAPFVLCAGLLLSACTEGQMPGFLQPKADKVAEQGSAPSAAIRETERDVEAPDIFAAKEPGLWDGRPSLGGVWVAHPDVQEPERAIIRNTTNGQFVIGALFRKERSTPGPRLQVSSDAAAALGMLAGAPTELDVVALRREQAPAAAPVAADTGGATLSAAPAVSEGALDPVIDSAAQALDAAPAPTPAPAPAAAPKTSSLDKPFLQIGIFSVEQNANNTAVAMRQAGLTPTIKPGTSSGKPFWRVIVGPAQTSAERAALLKTVKASGFEDAYAVTD
ncbi:SPOR domain-containing protein [Sagittula sp. SSi028]|uniref:SPOR domain-containing protein n=1 Tax=Sagittula sp. SSi028 TaxID=3400636 RepID=UPI003AF96CF1